MFLTFNSYISLCLYLLFPFLFVTLFKSISLCLYPSLSVYLSVYIFIYFSFYLHISLLLYLAVLNLIYLCLNLSLSLISLTVSPNERSCINPKLFGNCCLWGYNIRHYYGDIKANQYTIWSNYLDTDKYGDRTSHKY